MLDLVGLSILLSLAAPSYTLVTRSSSICIGKQADTCEFFQPSCDDGYKIRKLSAIYGRWWRKKKKKITRNTEGCCVYDPSDCSNLNAALPIPDLCTGCTWEGDCGPAQNADFNFLMACDNRVFDSYVYIEYECVAEEEFNMAGKCSGPESPMAPSVDVTTPNTSYTVRPDHINGTAGSTSEDGANSGAILAGVLIPILLLVVFGAILGYLLWRRRKTTNKAEFPGAAARPNTYTENTSNEPHENIYDEIGEIGDPSEPALNIPVRKPKHSSKYQRISSHTNRLLAWLRNARGANGTKCKTVTTVPNCSYDPIQSSNPMTVGETGDQSYLTPTGSSNSSDVTAVRKSHSYIEFKVDPTDCNDTNISTASPTKRQSSSKPSPPTRPPPSPSKSMHGSIPPDSALPTSTSPSTTFTYDYADSQPNSNTVFSGLTSANSSKDLKNPTEYDYVVPNDITHHLAPNGRSQADVSGDFGTHDGYETPITTQRSHDLSETEPMVVSNEPYIENTDKGQQKQLKPVSDKICPPKSAVGATVKGKNVVQATDKQPAKTSLSTGVYVNAASMLNGDKADVITVSTGAQVNTQNMNRSNLNESDTIKTNDSDKAPRRKGVRTMTRLFESKA